MTAELWIELLKMLVPFVTGSGITAYVFQKCLKRVASSQVVTDPMLANMLEGLEAIIRSKKGIEEEIRRLEEMMENKDFPPSELRKLEWELDASTRKFAYDINTHRMYIPSLLPMGGSSRYRHSGLVVAGFVNLLESSIRANDSQEREAILKRLRAAMNDLQTLHSEINENVTSIRKKLKSGEPIV